MIVTAGLLLGAFLVGLAPQALADTSPGMLDSITNSRFGKISLDARFRYEHADIKGLRDSNANTLRARLGFRTKSWQGFSLFAEVESIVSFDDGDYFDGVETPDGRSIVADPHGTDLNRLTLKYEVEEWGTSLVAGRQRIILDDARFVGNVGWRQNEQTYDASTFRSSFGRDDLMVTYAYVWDVNRIFGGTGPSALRDFNSDSHLVNLKWQGLEGVDVSLFAYLLDFENSPGNSSNSYGVRFNGSHELVPEWALTWSSSFAWQTDAAENAVDYGAMYLAADAKVGRSGLGALGLGWETLGSDNGRARFVTPLATAHKFNGWADAFLGNGGGMGLRDLYAYLTPKLPWKLKSRIAYHRYWSDEGSLSLGGELDVVVSRPIREGMTVLAKVAWFDSAASGPADRLRFWLQTSYAF